MKDKKPTLPPMEAFFTREKANDGVKFALTTPTGEDTDHWLLIRGVDSDEFQKARSAEARNFAKMAEIEDEEERNEAIEASAIRVMASLIGGWSFDRELTVDNIINFLTEAPQIREKIDEIASKRTLFFKMLSKNSKGTPEKVST